MISYLKGTINRSGNDYLVVVANGVGYQVFVDEKTLENVSVQEKTELHIYHHQTEKSEELYGFEKLPSLDLFESLLSVSGVGPKAAMALLSSLTTEELEEAITEGNSETLTVAPGIGKKVAHKIIAELSDTLAEEGLEGFPKSSSHRQAFDALLELGYNPVEAKTALRMVDNSIDDPEERIKEALKHLS
jgi:holliday junction DNA helicase RuvA